MQDKQPQKQSAKTQQTKTRRQTNG